MEGWVTPLATILVALIASSGVWGGVQLNRRLQQAAREDAARKAVQDREDRAQQQKLRAISYAARLRAHIEEGKPPPPEDWPEGIYD